MANEKLKKTGFHTAIWTAVAIWALVVGALLMRFAPELEGKYFPVVDPSLRITAIRADDGDGSIVSGTAFKARGECNFILGSLKWYLGTPERWVRVNAFFTDPPEVRSGGWHSWSGLRVALSPSQVVHNSFATVEHDCGAPWPVVSIYYQSAKE